MRLLREATVQEVLAASQWPAETRKLLVDYPVPKLYELNRLDVGAVTVTVQHPARDTDGPIRDVFENWQTWLTYPNQEAQVDRKIHLLLLAVLAQGNRFTTPPIIDERPRYHDGRHRLLAFFDFTKGGTGGQTMEVYRLEQDRPPEGLILPS